MKPIVALALPVLRNRTAGLRPDVSAASRRLGRGGRRPPEQPAGGWRYIALALFVLACGSSPPPPPAPTTWTSVPPSIVQALCTKLHSEGLSGTVNIVTTTSPLITRESLFGLAAAADEQGKKDPAKLNAVLAVASLKLPIAIEGTGSCELHPIASAAEGHSDEMLLEVSPPFVNPFVRKSTGLLARLSLAGEAPQWYWVPLGLHNGQWLPSLPTALAVPHG